MVIVCAVRPRDVAMREAEAVALPSGDGRSVFLAPMGGGRLDSNP